MTADTKKKLLNKRGYAFGIDFAIIVMTNYTITHLFTLTLTHLFYGLGAHSFNHMINSVWSFSHYSILALAFAYFSLFNYLNEGKSFGKMIIGLKVKNIDDSPLTLVQSMTRSFLNVASFKIFFFIFYVALIRKDTKSLSDLICKTVVDFDAEEAVKKSTLPTNENLLLINQIPDEGIFFEDEAA